MKMKYKINKHTTGQIFKCNIQYCFFSIKFITTAHL